jgi:POT family proton-dependent oligopeptide transporter
MEPTTPVKFAFGLVQLGLGFVALWYGAGIADARGMVPVIWLILGYLLFTTGELFLSPVGLSMITKLTPKYLVATVMGMWFLATAFSEFLAAILAQFTSVGGEGGDIGIPPPLQTVNVYGDVFGKISLIALASGVVLLILSPLLTRWMHEGAKVEAAEAPEGLGN